MAVGDIMAARASNSESSKSSRVTSPLLSPPSAAKKRPASTPASALARAPRTMLAQPRCRIGRIILQSAWSCPQAQALAS
eukprot:3939638-Rhodomonas_salina.2